MRFRKDHNRTTIVEHSRRFVIGVDTRATSHTYAVIEAANRQLLGCQQFSRTATGIARAINWKSRLVAGEATALWSSECIATSGAKLARAAAEAGYEVVGASRISTKARRGLGTPDPLDAQTIATATLCLDDDRLRHLRADDRVPQALRVLVTAREQMAQEKTINTNALTALLGLNDRGIDARKPLTLTQNDITQAIIVPSTQRSFACSSCPI